MNWQTSRRRDVGAFLTNLVNEFVDRSAVDALVASGGNP